MEGNTPVTASCKTIGRFATLIILLVITGCSDSPDETGIEEPKVEHPGFSASVSGAVNAEVSGAGIRPNGTRYRNGESSRLLFDG